LNALDIIHGDIKPENVLIVEDNPGEYHAKLADFGYSTLNMSRQEDASIVLPISWPWSAPEISKEDFCLPFLGARAADYFSFGMLCLWILFTDKLSDSLERGEDLQKLDELKKDGSLKSYALQLVTKNISGASELPHEYAEGLSYFFRWTLAHDPLQRIGTLKKQHEIAKSAHDNDLEAKENGKTLPDRGLVSSMGITYEDVFGVQSPFGYFSYVKTILIVSSERHADA
jgi:serine/threonine protein kinase